MGPNWDSSGQVGPNLPHLSPIWVPHLEHTILSKHKNCIYVSIIPNSLSLVLKTHENEYLNKMWKKYKVSFSYWDPSWSHL